MEGPYRHTNASPTPAAGQKGDPCIGVLIH